MGRDGAGRSRGGRGGSEMWVGVQRGGAYLPIPLEWIIFVRVSRVGVEWCGAGQDGVRHGVGVGGVGGCPVALAGTEQGRAGERGIHGRVGKSGREWGAGWGRAGQGGAGQGVTVRGGAELCGEQGGIVQIGAGWDKSPHQLFR